LETSEVCAAIIADRGDGMTDFQIVGVVATIVGIIGLLSFQHSDKELVQKNRSYRICGLLLGFLGPLLILGGLVLVTNFLIGR
jgi:hypothetical protein